VNDSLLGRINSLAEDIFRDLHAQKPFIPGETHIPVTGKYFGKEEIASAIRASGEFWLTSGPHAENFERQIAQRVGVRHAFMVNSGSSANLIAISALTSNKLGERRLRPGDEVLTVAAGFPTTVAPIIQNGLVPVYIDIDLGTYVAKAEMLEEAIGPKTKAIMMAHTL
jgi:CDP-6-deoxy-D-xylo-4-hexulose-3-dehydrase